jgi:hypothetical protein
VRRESLLVAKRLPASEKKGWEKGKRLDNKLFFLNIKALGILNSFLSKNKQLW